MFDVEGYGGEQDIYCSCLSGDYEPEAKTDMRDYLQYSKFHNKGFILALGISGSFPKKNDIQMKPDRMLEII